jgi:ribosomal protein L11 methyltransferase
MADEIWMSARIEVERDQVEALEALLDQAGASAISLSDAADHPVFQEVLESTPLWPEVVIEALFPPGLGQRKLSARLHPLLGDELSQRLSVVGLEPRQWERVWLEHFKPLQFGPRLWVYPTGFEPPNQGEVALRLDPGLAFGTGTHPTTHLCLAWLDEQAELPGRVIDYGCGSGILAVAAALLGSRQIVAVDHDEQAVLATAQNAERNLVSERIEGFLPHQAPGDSAPLVLANILAGTLIELAEQLTELTQPGGTLVLSGILSEQADSVAAAYQSAFGDMERREYDGWVLMAGKRN